MVNGLPNLQLLEGHKNIKKLDSMPAEWIASAFDTDAGRTNYCENHLLGNIPDSIADFKGFYEGRLESLRHRIVDLLAVQATE